MHEQSIVVYMFTVDRSYRTMSINLRKKYDIETAKIYYYELQRCRSYFNIYTALFGKVSTLWKTVYLVGGL